jgi:hypothetical protein
MAALSLAVAAFDQQDRWAQVLGVGVAGLARTLKAPMLLAVVCGIAATALLRLLLA